MIETLHNWQTLFGSVLALIAAAWTVCTMRKQISAESSRHAEALARKSFSARARMPVALMDMHRYVQECGRWIGDQKRSKPDTPTGAIIELREVIEHIDTHPSERVFDVVSWYQVFIARVDDSDLSNPDSITVADRIYDATLLLAYVTSLFGYARNEEPAVKYLHPSLEGMMLCYSQIFTLQESGLYPRVASQVEELIKKNHTSGYVGNASPSP